MNWKWSNVPIPEAFVVGLVLGLLLHFLLPLAIFPGRSIGYALGALVALAGIALATWAVLEASNMAIDSPDRLLTTGPYAWTRNPMYVAWTLITLGTALFLNTIWLLILMPFALAYIRLVDIKREERQLEEQFGENYMQYCARVRRYL